MSENVPNTSGHSGGQSEQPKFVPAAPPVAPAGNAYSGYVPTKLPAGMAIASLVMGIVSILGALPLSFITIVVALVGLILGIIALRKVRKGTGGGKGMAIGGRCYQCYWLYTISRGSCLAHHRYDDDAGMQEYWCAE